MSNQKLPIKRKNTSVHFSKQLEGPATEVRPSEAENNKSAKVNEAKDSDRKSDQPSFARRAHPS